MNQPTDARSNDERRLRVAQAVHDWSTPLIDLSARNQLLNYRAQRNATVELTNAPSSAVATLLSGAPVRLSQLLPPDGASALKRARRIHRRALALFEERGIHTLFLAYGIASWATTTTSTPAAPVLLRPLTLNPRGASAEDFDLRLHGDWDVNETLLHVLNKDFTAHVSREELLRLLDTSDVPEPTQVFERLRKGAWTVPDLDVRDRVVIAALAYTKLPMVKDLQGNVEQLASHDLVAAIAGAGHAYQAQGVDGVNEARDDMPPADEFLIADADASQHAVIKAALAGQSLIVQGPPGTGKSQTIANLIASMMAGGKRVLFVAEKRAAIDSVTKRLRNAGLGDLLVDLHGGMASTKKLAADLVETAEEIGRVPSIDIADLHHKLKTTRSALTNHANAMHVRRDPWGVSIFEATGRLLEFNDSVKTEVRFTPAQLADLDGETVRQVRDQLSEWSGLAEPIIAGDSAWSGVRVTTGADAKQVLSLVRGLITSLPDAQRRLEEMLSETTLSAPRSLEEWRHTMTLLAGIADTLSFVDAAIFELDLQHTSDALRPEIRGWSRRAFAQVFSRRYRNAKSAIKAVWLDDEKPKGPRLYATAAVARAQAAEWQARGGTDQPRLPDRLEDALSIARGLAEKVTALSAYFVTRNLARCPLDELVGQLDALLDDQQTLLGLPRMQQLRQTLTRHHVAPLVHAAEQGEVSPGAVAEAFEYAWLASIRAHVSTQDPRLASFRGSLHDRRVKLFSAADRDHVHASGARVRRAVAENATRVRDRHGAQDKLVGAQARRTRGHMSLRRLFEEAPEVLTALRPCWAMSPLMVSQTLPAAAVFDAVIFDEASQIQLADAVPALLRAPQAVVVGDRHQLRPTAFFDSGGAAGESVLDALDAVLPHHGLARHYRSFDEKLIAFSNGNVYDGALVTFPGARSGDSLRYVQVPHRPREGIDTRSNDEEVRRVVELVLEHATDHAGESLGVITLGQHHRRRIEAALRDRLASERNPALDRFFDEAADEPVFVKNLERVQGDERDAVILSVGYGKQPDGRLLYRFGPLLNPGGERRLNVAVTRARRRLTLVSSFSYADMDPTRSSAAGVELLRRYLRYVETGGTEVDGAKHLLDAFQADVKRRLERAGLRVIPHYGTSNGRIEFALPHPTEPGRMVLAVETDGPAYHRSPSARDRDRLRHEVLERRGWRFHRIWSTDWYDDPEAETARVVEVYHAARRQSGDRDDAARATAREEKPARTGDRPVIRPGASIVDYSRQELVALVRWIKSDTLPRTERQLLNEMIHELGLERRNGRTVSRLLRAIKTS